MTEPAADLIARQMADECLSAGETKHARRDIWMVVYEAGKVIDRLAAEAEGLRAELAAKTCPRCEVDGYWFKATKVAVAERDAGHAAGLAEREWRPIATAPKDGTYVLGYFPDPGDWLSPCGVVPVKWVDKIAFWATKGVCGLLPTHWMPLPLSPEPPKGEERT